MPRVANTISIFHALCLYGIAESSVTGLQQWLRFSVIGLEDAASISSASLYLMLRHFVWKQTKTS